LRKPFDPDPNEFGDLFYSTLEEPNQEEPAGFDREGSFSGFAAPDLMRADSFEME